MKSHTFLPTFIRYSFTALITLWIVYLLADMHINKIPGFGLAEGFMIAGEALVFCAFILAFKDTRQSPLEIMLQDAMKDFARSIHNHKEHEERCSETQYGPSFTISKEKKTTKGIPLSEEHKKKISESLKRKNAEKKAQAARIARTAAQSAKRKSAKK